jgi:predicted metalloprotease
VIAHEVGHHVQNLMGVMDKFEQQSQRSDSRNRNALSVRLAL